MSQRFSHYRILERIGAGGMGVVYRARDERLDRDVALKMLPPELIADSDARQQLTREARALSQLNHPNIAAVYSLEADGSAEFIVLEWVPGQTLDARVAGGALDEAEVVRLAIQAAEALIAAHAAGVVHRDLKPGNLRLTPEGDLKVLDFGLARRTRLGDSSVTTMSAGIGAAGGTLAYMPPETFLGQPGDARGDLYSLGVVLYELATGRRPFSGGTVPETIHAILHQSVVAPRTLNGTISPGLQAIILHLLQRDPVRRYESARALRGDLATLRDGHAVPPIRSRPSIAVLPFVNLSGDPSQDYFADGMTEALIGDLARLRELRVISRTSVMRYKAVQRAIADIAAELNVESVLEGSVLRGADRVRVNVQLIEALSDTHLWAERYDRPMQDILALQSDVAEAVVREIRGTLLASAAPPIAATLAPTPSAAVTKRRVDPAAYDAYLRGRYQLNRRNDESLHRAVALFQSAIERDPGYALAHAGLAEAFAVLGYYEFTAPAESFPVARAAARRALDIEPELAQAYATLAYVELHFDWNWTAAERDFLRAIELGPNEPLARSWYANLLGASARFGPALEQIRRGLEFDPLSLILHVVAGWTYFFERRYLEALESLERTLELEPAFFPAHLWRAWTLVRLARETDAVTCLTAAAELIQHEPSLLQCQVHAHAFAGRADDARAALNRLEGLRAERHVSAFAIAVCHEALGDHRRAIDWLEIAKDEHAPGIGYLNVDGRLDSLRGDPRFEALRALAGSGGSPPRSVPA